MPGYNVTKYDYDGDGDDNGGNDDDVINDDDVTSKVQTLLDMIMMVMVIRH